MQPLSSAVQDHYAFQADTIRLREPLLRISYAGNVRWSRLSRICKSSVFASDHGGFFGNSGGWLVSIHHAARPVRVDLRPQNRRKYRRVPKRIELMYEIFEHTADLGLRVKAPDLEALFADAGRGLTSMIAANLEAIRPVRAVPLRVAGTRRDDLLFDWLSEILYLFESEHLLLSDFEVRLDDEGLQATARGEPLDESRHQLEHEVKAITYHGLKVEQTSDGWLAEVIVDI